MSRVGPWLLSAAAYTAFAFALCHGVVSHPSTTLPSDLGDPLLNTWILWWNAQVTPLTRAWWNAPIFFPLEGALALSETLLGIALITTPLQWAGISAVPAYNIAFVGSFIASALAAHLLVWRLTRRHDAALIAGLVYGFNPYRTAHAPHIQLLSSYWLPLALVGLHEYVQSGRARALVLFACCWTLQSLVSGYFLIYSSTLVALWIIWFAHTSWRRPAAVGAAWAVAGIACLPVLIGYQRVQTALGLRRNINEIDLFGADLSALLAAPPSLLVWGNRLVSPRQEGELFLGFTAALVVALAIWRTARGPIGRSTIRLLALAVVPVAIGLIAFWTGGFAVGPISVTRAFKPISVGVWMVTVAALLSVPFRRSLRSQSAFAFYVFATVVMFMCAMGPTPRAFGHRFWYEAPYRLLLELPGFNGVRVPARFGALAALTFAAAAGLAFDRIRPRARSTAHVAMAAVAIGIAIDSASALSAVRVPDLAAVAEVPGAAAVVELPFGALSSDVRAMFHATKHGRPVVNGYSGYAPPYYAALTAGLTEGDPRTLETLATRGPLAVLVNGPSSSSGAWSHLLTASGARVVSEQEGATLIWIDRASVAEAVCDGQRLPIAAIRANGGTDPRLAIDGDPATGWHGDTTQKGGEQIVIDLGAAHRTDVLTLVHGPFTYDFPRGLRIESSQDERSWTEVWKGSVASHVFEGALADPRLAPARISLGRGGSSRFLALTQTGQTRDAVWSIAELEVCGR